MSEEQSKEERYAIMSGKWQIIVENTNTGKKVAMQHPYPTFEEAEEEVGRVNQRYPEKTIMNGDDVLITWNKLNIYRRKTEYPMLVILIHHIMKKSHIIQFFKCINTSTSIYIMKQLMTI